MKKYDIIIAGAGPAGLSVAKELSKDYKVLIIDKNKAGFTTSTWYSYKNRIKKHKLQRAVLKEFKGLLYVAPPEYHIMKDKCVVLDETKVLNIWLNQAKSNNAEFKQLNYTGFEKTSNGVIVKTNKENFESKLLIDCVGITSPVIKKNNLIKTLNTWSIYGYEIICEPLANAKQIQFLPLNDKQNTYIGLYPVSKNQVKIYAFVNLEDEIGNPVQVKKKIDSYIKSMGVKKILKTFMGRIPSGELHKYAYDNFVFFGSSGMLNPPGCGMGFNEILMQHKKFCKRIKKLMKKNSVDKKNLHNLSMTLRNQDTIDFQRIIGRFTFYFIKSPDKWTGGVRWLNKMGRLSKYWMRNELSLAWISKATKKLHKSIPFHETIKYFPLKEFKFLLTHSLLFAEKLIKYHIKKTLEYDFKKLSELEKKNINLLKEMFSK